MFKKIAITFLLFAVLFSAFSCKGEGGVFTYCEMHLPLGTDFSTSEYENFDAVYKSDRYIVALVRISFVAAVREGIGETMSPYEFGNFWVEKCGRNETVVKDNVCYTEYYDISDGAEYYYLEAFFRSQYAYFAVLFVAPSVIQDTAKTDFLNYSKNIYFKG